MKSIYRFAFDLGTNSLGWCVYRLDNDYRPNQIAGLGVRIYSDSRDAKSKAPLTVDRRNARSARRRQDRFVKRKNALIKDLIRFGLMPDDKQEREALKTLNVYELRTKGLDEKLPLHHIGRAIFHLNQRRGFKSNRKTDARDTEAGKIKIGVQRLDEAMAFAEARTFGELLYFLSCEGETVRTRMRVETGEDNKEIQNYNFYPSRAHLEAEFDMLTAAQAEYHPEELNPGTVQRLRDVIFYQRPLKAQQVGKCMLLPDETRIAKAHPLFQERRLLEELNSLRICSLQTAERPLTLEERDKLYHYLSEKRDAAFLSLAKLLKLPDENWFNKQTASRNKLKGHEINAILGAKSIFGKRWHGFSIDRQWEIISHLKNEENPDKLQKFLLLECGLDEQQAQKAAMANLPNGYSDLGETAQKSLIREYKADVIVYSEAVKRAPELDHHSDIREEPIKTLPYYAHIINRHIPPGTGDPEDAEEVKTGRITNPTVHVGLNQLRKITNALIKCYGVPHSIIIEVARDLKLNEKQKSRVIRTQAFNTKAAEERSKKLEELGIADSGRNRLLLRLWEDLNPKQPLDRRCPYTGQLISIAMLFTHEVDIDHILPFSKTFDDSAANKTVCIADANKRKGNRTPYEAFHGTADWPEIERCAANLPKNKAWRFSANALERYEKDGGFEARQLTDTQYIARMAGLYLSAVCPTQRSLPRSGVSVVPGRLTEMLRRNWGLNHLLPDHNVSANAKNRSDHRHHAIDAVVIGATDRGLLQKISKVAARNQQNQVERIVAGIELPFEGFRDELNHKINQVIVSHRPDKGKPKYNGGTTAQLHNDTAYGITGETNEKGVPLVVHKVPFLSLNTEKRLRLIRDDQLKSALLDVTEGKTGKAFTEALQEFAEAQTKLNGPFAGIRSARILEALNVILITDKTGRPYKSFKSGGNYRFDVWELPNGKWKANAVSVFDAHQKNFDPDQVFRAENNLPPTARKVLRLQQNDMVAYDHPENGYTVARVVKFDQAGRICLSAHNEGNVAARNSDKNDPFTVDIRTATALQKINIRQIRITELGKIYDPLLQKNRHDSNL